MTQTIELTIRGMDGAECAMHIEELLRKIDGVQSAQVFLTAEKGVVSFDPARRSARCVGALARARHSADDYAHGR